MFHSSETEMDSDLMTTKMLNEKRKLLTTVGDAANSSLLELFALKLSNPWSTVERSLSVIGSSQFVSSSGSTIFGRFVLLLTQYGLKTWFQLAFRCLSPFGQFVELFRWILNELFRRCSWSATSLSHVIVDVLSLTLKLRRVSDEGHLFWNYRKISGTIMLDIKLLGTVHKVRMQCALYFDHLPLCKLFCMEKLTKKSNFWPPSSP